MRTHEIPEKLFNEFIDGTHNKSGVVIADGTGNGKSEKWSLARRGGGTMAFCKTKSEGQPIAIFLLLDVHFGHDLLLPDHRLRALFTGSDRQPPSMIMELRCGHHRSTLSPVWQPGADGIIARFPRLRGDIAFHFRTQREMDLHADAFIIARKAAAFFSSPECKKLIYRTESYPPELRPWT